MCRKSSTHAPRVGIVGELFPSSLALKEPTSTTPLHLFDGLVGNHIFVKVGTAAICGGRLLPSESPLRRLGVRRLWPSTSALRDHSLGRMRKRQLLCLQNAAEIANTRMRARWLLTLLNQRARGAREGRFYDRPRRLLALHSQGALGAREGRE
jgi:hypothetical protein